MPDAAGAWRLPERGGFSPASRRAAPGRLRALSGQRRTGRRVLAWRRVAAAVGGVGVRAKAALTGAWEPPTRRRLLGRCSLRSPRASPAAPRGAGVLEAAQRMGGRECPRPLLLCLIVTQAISCLEVWEKEKKNPGWGQGDRGGGEPESGGLEETRVGSGCHLLTSSPRGCLAREPEEKCSLLQCYFGGTGKDRGWLTHATQRWGRGCGRRDHLVTPARAPTPLPLLCKTAAELSSPEGQAEFAVLPSFFVTWSAFRSLPGV